MPDALRPLFDQVVIKELEPERMRKSGLLVPQGTHDLPPNEGIVLAVGDGPPELPDFKMPVAPGDHVVIKELEPERMRKSGLLVPQGTHDLPPNEGIVLTHMSPDMLVRQAEADFECAFDGLVVDL